MSQENKREQILKVAEKLFGEKGFKGVSIREITTKARANVSAVNYYFGNKKGLYLAVFEELWIERARKQRHYLQQRLAAYESLSINIFVKEVILSYLTGPISQDIKKYHHALIQKELSEPSEALDLVLQKAICPMLDLLVSTLESIYPGKLSSEQKMIYALTLIAISIHFNLVGENILKILPFSSKENQQDLVASTISDLLTNGFKGLCIQDEN